MLRNAISRREDRLKKSVRPTIKRLVYSKSMRTIALKLNYFLIQLFLS